MIFFYVMGVEEKKTLRRVGIGCGKADMFFFVLCDCTVQNIRQRRPKTFIEHFFFFFFLLVFFFFLALSTDRGYTRLNIFFAPFVVRMNPSYLPILNDPIF